MAPRIKQQLCTAHFTGVPIGMGPFFEPSCTRCQAKLAAGKVTGKEPTPAEASKVMSKKRHTGILLSGIQKSKWQKSRGYVDNLDL